MIRGPIDWSRVPRPDPQETADAWCLLLAVVIVTVGVLAIAFRVFGQNGG